MRLRGVAHAGLARPVDGRAHFGAPSVSLAWRNVGRSRSAFLWGGRPARPAAAFQIDVGAGLARARRARTFIRLRAAARAGGMRTLAEDGVLKVFKGVSTAEEISRNAQVEGIVEEQS